MTLEEVIEQKHQAEKDKYIAIQAHLPSWVQVETYLDEISNLTEAKVALKKIARIVYWLAKNSSQ